jgi:uncharacterized protein YbcI
MEKQQQVEEMVRRFLGTYMSAQPQSILVDLHDSHVLVTLRQVICPAEREYARERTSRERLERLSCEAFDGVKAELEKAVTKILGRTVLQSRISLDPPTGDAILLLVMEESMKPRGVGR